MVFYAVLNNTPELYAGRKKGTAWGEPMAICTLLPDPLTYKNLLRLHCRIDEYIIHPEF